MTTIDALRINGFGRFADLRVELDRGLNLLLGPNEAGKSTLMAFIRSVLFGFDRRQSARRYEPRTGNAFGGELTLKTQSGTLVVQRSGSRRRVEGELVLRDASGAILPEAALGVALGGANRELFCQVFAITVDELKGFESLASESSVSEALFAAGMQGAHRLPEAMSTLATQAAALWGERAQKRPLNLALGALAETRARLDGALERPEAYFEALSEQNELGRALDQAQVELEALRAREVRLERLSRASSPLVALVALGDERLIDDGSPEALPRFENLEARRAELASSRVALGARVADLEAKLAALERSRASRGSLSPTRVALSGWQAVAALAAGLPGREVELVERKRAVEARLVRLLGRSEGAEWLASVDVGASRVAELQALRDREVRVTQERARAEDAVAAAEAERERLTRDREDALSRRAQKSPATEAIDTAVDALEQYTARGLRREHLEARRLAVRERLALSAELSAPQTLPGLGLPLVALAALTLAVVAAVIAGGPRVGASAVGAGLVVAGVVLVLVARARREAASALAARAEALAAHQRAWSTEAAGLEDEIAALSREQEALARVAGLSSPAAASTRMLELGRAKQLAESQLRLNLEVDQLERDLAATVERKREAGRRLAASVAELDAIQEDVDRRASAAGLPSGVFAQRTVDLMVELSRLQDDSNHLHRDASALEDDARRVDEARSALRHQAVRLGVDDTAPSADALAAALSELVLADEQEREEARQAQARLEDFRLALSRLDAEASEVEGLLSSLLSAVGAPDGELLRVRAQLVLEVRRREQRRKELTLEVRAAAGLEPGEAKAAIEAEGELGPALVEARSAIAALDERVRGVASRLGQLEERTQAMATESQTAALRLDEATRLSHTARLAQEHAELAMARAILQRARQRFERAHQPRVVKRTQGLFSELTLQRYVGLSVDVPRQSLVVHDAQGAPWTVAELSRGTRELLLLAFRLAVVEDFGETRARLPLILDDVLVDLDEHRAARLVELLSTMSSRHQIIAMTCHRHVRHLFEAFDANVVSVHQGVQLSLLGDQGGKGAP